MKTPSNKCIIPATPGKRKRRYADMRVLEVQPGCWAVVEVEYDRVVIAGFSSMAQAWAWLDRQMYERYHRIRQALSR